MFKLILPLALLAVPTFAAADGYEGSYKDGGYAARPSAYSYSYSIKQSRGGWECPREFARHECRRLQAEVARRRAREDRPRKVVMERRVPVYRDSEPRPSRAAFGGRRCAGFVKVDGPARWLSALATGAARKEWRRKVRTTYGERYVDESFSPNFSVSRPRIVGDRGIAVRATAQGLACSGD